MFYVGASSSEQRERIISLQNDINNLDENKLFKVIITYLYVILQFIRYLK